MAKKKVEEKRAQFIVEVKPLRGRLDAEQSRSWAAWCWTVALGGGVELRYSSTLVGSEAEALAAGKRYCREHGIELIEDDR